MPAQLWRAPSKGNGTFSYQLLEAATVGLLTFTGPHALLGLVYKSLEAGISELRNYKWAGLTAVELYHSTQGRPSWQLMQTELMLPIEKIRS